MTANAMDNDKQDCFAAGMDDFIPKPFEMEDLTRALNKASQILEQVVE
jgi:CheY-like chemotaxis protein